MAIMLLSKGWNARNVEAGGGGMNVVMTWQRKTITGQGKRRFEYDYKIIGTNRHTLNVIMLNKDTFPPAADIT